jgi:hypothetical protein
LLRHQIALVAPPGSEYATICVSTHGFRPPSDPPAELILRLRDVVPPVKPWSACKWNELRPIDVATGLPAVQVAQDIRCADADHCSGTGGYAFGNLGAAYFNYSLERQRGRWIVNALITAVS